MLGRDVAVARSSVRVHLGHHPREVTGAGEIGGHCAPGYEGVREAFRTCFAELGETGAAVACTVDGRLVVDLYGGWSDADRLRPWSPSTLVHVWSVTKPLAALAVLFLVDRGLVGLDEWVAAHWPEYAAAGKETTTIRHLLAHQAGLAEVPEHVTLELLADHEALAPRLAAASPEWAPGTQHGEHALLYGTLLGELVRRVDGRSLGTLLRAEITGPWQIDFHVGLSPEERGRTAELVDEGGRWRSELLASPFGRVLGRPPEVLDVATTNSESWRAAEVAAVNGHATAVGVARLQAALAAGGELDGVRLLSKETVDELL